MKKKLQKQSDEIAGLKTSVKALEAELSASEDERDTLRTELEIVAAEADKLAQSKAVRMQQEKEPKVGLNALEAWADTAGVTLRSIADGGKSEATSEAEEEQETP